MANKYNGQWGDFKCSGTFSVVCEIPSHMFPTYSSKNSTNMVATLYKKVIAKSRIMCASICNREKRVCKGYHFDGNNFSCSLKN